ncbi:hypothetical protein ACFTXO_14470 [Streptomyces sp. NPDC057067]|jgi:hypothetical protein
MAHEAELDMNIGPTARCGARDAAARTVTRRAPSRTDDPAAWRTYDLAM